MVGKSGSWSKRSLGRTNFFCGVRSGREEGHERSGLGSVCLINTVIKLFFID